MKKCPKCSNELKKSKFNTLHGYESYRCSNIDCNSLFDISDLNKISISLNTLIKPINLDSHHDYYFDQLIEDKKTKIPTGYGKSYFLLKICEANPEAVIVCASKIFHAQYMESMNLMHRTKNLKKIFPERVVSYYHYRANPEDMKDKILLIDELPNHLKNNLLSQLNNQENCYIIND